jgi:hypothetical protein
MPMIAATISSTMIQNKNFAPYFPAPATEAACAAPACAASVKMLVGATIGETGRDGHRLGGPGAVAGYGSSDGDRLPRQE